MIQYAHICGNNGSDELIRLGEQEGFGIDKESIDENQVWTEFVCSTRPGTLKDAIYHR